VEPRSFVHESLARHRYLAELLLIQEALQRERDVLRRVKAGDIVDARLSQQP
jgi:hypothetical protein